MVRSTMESAHVIGEDHISKFERDRRGQFFDAEVGVQVTARALMGTCSMEMHRLNCLRGPPM